MPGSGDGERAMPNAWGKLRGGPPGNRHAWKHGRYSRAAIERRWEVAELVSSMRALVRQFGT